MDEANRKRRDLILNGNILFGIISVCAPMAVFQLINQFFRVFDLSITAQISTQSVAAVSFFSQLSNTFGSIGGGFSMGAGIIIAGHYGAADYHKVKQTVNTSFAISVLMAALLSATLIGFSPFVLKLANTPLELTQIGLNYYRCEMLGLVLSFFNSTYIAVEKARGNGKVILWLNIILAFSKFSLSALFVLVLKQGIVMISVATLLANLVVAMIGIFRLRKKDDIFGLSFSYVNLKWYNVSKLLRISLPVMAEKVAFSAGKVMVNSIGVSYGTQVVGALGVSNSMSSLSTMPPSSIGDGGAAIIRQNLGNKNKPRALEVFKCIFVINLLLGIFGFFVTYMFLNPLVAIFSNGDLTFAALAKQIFMLEMLSNIFLAINSSVMGLLYGFGYTKISFALNFARLFVFRLPVLIYFQHFTSLSGGTAMGTVMMFSNAVTGILSILIAIYIVKKEYGLIGLKNLFKLGKKEN